MSRARSVAATAAWRTPARDGADVVQVYAELPDPERPKRLVGFARVEVPAGQSAPFTIAEPRERSATRENGGWRPAAGEHRLVVARHAGDPQARNLEVEL